MKTATNSPGRIIFRFAGVLLVWSALPARASEVLIEGFEKAAGLKTSGKVALVKGADAVTEGAGALELHPGAAVTLTIPAGAASKVGWLKIDTFEVQPVMACLQLTLKGQPPRTGYVSPGKDTLAMPLGLVARAYRGAWPKGPLTLELRNTGRESVVIDNARLVSPAAAPVGTVLLDFGPPNQALWPGFEHAASQGAGITWSGNHKIIPYANNYPDPLAGDFAGPRLGYKQLETVSIRSKGAGSAWVWLTHYAYHHSAPLEYAAKFNRRTVLRNRLTPAQMLSTDGLFRGRHEPWTNEWLERSFVPAAVSRLELTLKAGRNVLELANCQLAALITSPRSKREAAGKYVQLLEQDLRRYRRQFVLAAQHRPRNTVAATADESKAGLILFLPARDEWFNRNYSPKPEHRAKVLELTVAAGSAATAALVAAPCKDGALLQAQLDTLRDPAGGFIPRTRCRLEALEAMPAVRNARVAYQPFLPAHNHRPVRAGEVCWFILRIAAPDQARAGNYKGTIRVRLDRTSAELPVALRVVRLRPAKQRTRRTFGVLSSGDCFEVYRSLKNIMPPQRRSRTSRQILSGLFDAGLNATMVNGPALSRTLQIIPSPLVDGLRTFPRPKRPGKVLINLAGAFAVLRAHQIQPETGRYINITRDMVRLCNDQARKSGLADYALYCGHARLAENLAEIARTAATVRRAGGRPAVGTHASLLNKMPPARRAALLKSLDTLICIPDHKEIGAVGEELNKTGAAKTFALRLTWSDTYAAGFYCWAVGADGAYAGQIFFHRPLFNAFSFSPRSLLLPTPKGDFKPTLALAKFVQAIDDYDLARRCDALVRAAKRRNVDAKGLEKILTEIRIAADSRPPRFDPQILQSTSAPPEQLQKWRVGLILEAAKVSEKMREPPKRRP